MFFILKIEEEKKNLSKKIAEYFQKPKITTEKIETANLLAFYAVTAQKHRGKIPWEEIEKAAGRFCKRAVLQSKVVIPENVGIKKFEPKVFDKILLFNSAVSVLEKLSLDPLKMSVTVFDENGYLTAKIEKLVMLCSQIRVVTSCIQSYEDVARMLFEKYGISLIISQSAGNSILTSTAVISDKSADVPLIYHGLLFTNQRRKMLNATVLCGKEFSLPKEIENLVPNGVDRLTFASALYELCAAKQLEDAVYSDMKI